MKPNVRQLPAAMGPAYICPGEIISVEANGYYSIRMDFQGQTGRITATPAMAARPLLKAGDRVLVGGESPAAGYIIGVLGGAEQTPDAANTLRTKTGAGARVEQNGNHEHIAVQDTGGRTIFEYFPDSGKTVVHVPQGDLHLAAPQGSIELSAGRQIRCNGAGEVSISGQKSISLSVDGREDLPPQSLQLNADGVQLGVHALDLTAGRGEFSIGRAAYSGKLLNTHVDHAKMVYGRLETIAERLWERTGDVVRQTRNLYQLKAGRLRTLIQGALHLQSERTTIIAREDVRVDGTKINLG